MVFSLSSVRDQRAVVVRRRGHDPEPLILNAVRTAQDPGAWGEDIPPGDPGKIWSQHTYYFLCVCAIDQRHSDSNAAARYVMMSHHTVIVACPRVRALHSTRQYIQPTPPYIALVVCVGLMTHPMLTAKSFKLIILHTKME